MPLRPAPIDTPVDVDIARGVNSVRDPASIYRDRAPDPAAGRGTGGSDEIRASWAIVNSATLARWFQDLVAWVNRDISGGSVTCGPDTDTVAGWICGLWADDQALQDAVAELFDDIDVLQGEVEDLQDEIDALIAVQYWADNGGGEIGSTNASYVNIYQGLAVAKSGDPQFVVGDLAIFANLPADDPDFPVGTGIVENDGSGNLGYFPYSVAQILADIAAVATSNWLDAGGGDIENANAGAAIIRHNLEINETVEAVDWIGTHDFFYVDDGFGIYSAAGYTGITFDGAATRFNSYDFVDPDYFPVEAAAFLGDETWDGAGWTNITFRGDNDGLGPKAFRLFISLIDFETLLAVPV